MSVIIPIVGKRYIAKKTNGGTIRGICVAAKDTQCILRGFGYDVPWYSDVVVQIADIMGELPNKIIIFSTPTGESWGNDFIKSCFLKKDHSDDSEEHF